MEVNYRDYRSPFRFRARTVKSERSLDF